MSHKAEYYFMWRGKLSNNREHSLGRIKQDQYTYSSFYRLFYKRKNGGWDKVDAEEVPIEFKTILLIEGILNA